MPICIIGLGELELDHEPCIHGIIVFFFLFFCGEHYCRGYLYLSPFFLFNCWWPETALTNVTMAVM